MSEVRIDEKVKIKKMGSSAYLMLKKYGFEVGNVVDVYKNEKGDLILKKIKED